LYENFRSLSEEYEQFIVRKEKKLTSRLVKDQL